MRQAPGFAGKIRYDHEPTSDGSADGCASKVIKQPKICNLSLSLGSMRCVCLASLIGATPSFCNKLINVLFGAPKHAVNRNFTRIPVQKRKREIEGLNLVCFVAPSCIVILFRENICFLISAPLPTVIYEGNYVMIYHSNGIADINMIPQVYIIPRRYQI